MQFTKEELKNLITDALADFNHGNCPYCQAYIGLDEYIAPEDVAKWLDKRFKEVGNGN